MLKEFSPLQKKKLKSLQNLGKLYEIALFRENKSKLALSITFFNFFKFAVDNLRNINIYIL